MVVKNGDFHPMKKERICKKIPPTKQTQVTVAGMQGWHLNYRNFLGFRGRTVELKLLLTLDFASCNIRFKMNAGEFKGYTIDRDLMCL